MNPRINAQQKTKLVNFATIKGISLITAVRNRNRSKNPMKNKTSQEMTIQKLLRRKEKPMANQRLLAYP